MNLVRSVLFVLWIYLFMAILAIVCLPLIIFSRRVAVEAVRFWIKVTRLSLRIMLGIKTEIRGVEHLPKGAII